MANHLENMMDNTMEKIRQMVDVNTIIGEPVICPDGTVIIPVSKVSYGFASGGSDLPSKNAGTKENNFAGGSGAGVSIQPVAFLVVNNGNVKMLNMEFDGAVDRVIAMIPDISDKVSELFRKMGKDKKKDDIIEDIPEAKPVRQGRVPKKSDAADEAADVDNTVF